MRRPRADSEAITAVASHLLRAEADVDGGVARLGAGEPHCVPDLKRGLVGNDRGGDQQLPIALQAAARNKGRPQSEVVLHYRGGDSLYGDEQSGMLTAEAQAFQVHGRGKA